MCVTYTHPLLLFFCNMCNNLKVEVKYSSRKQCVNAFGYAASAYLEIKQENKNLASWGTDI